MNKRSGIHRFSFGFEAMALAVAMLSVCLWSGPTASGGVIEIINYNFDDGTFQGWTPVVPYNQLSWAVSSNTSGSRGGAQSPSHKVLPEAHGSRDIAHDTLWLRSPVFQLGDYASLTFYMLGGASAALPNNEDDVPLTSSTSGRMGIALRRVSDGEFVLKYSLAGNRDSTNSLWLQGVWTEAQLAPFAGDFYTLDLIDYRDGGWAFIHLDTVSIPTIPEPTTALLLLGSLTTALLSRRRR